MSTEKPLLIVTISSDSVVWTIDLGPSGCDLGDTIILERASISLTSVEIEDMLSVYSNSLSASQRHLLLAKQLVYDGNRKFWVLKDTATGRHLLQLSAEQLKSISKHYTAIMYQVLDLYKNHPLTIP